MKKIITPLFVALTFATSVFAQEDTDTGATDQTATVKETTAEPQAAAEKPNKEEKKAPIAVGSKEERPLGIRVGFHFSGINTPKRSNLNSGTYTPNKNSYPYFLGDASKIGWDVGVLYDLMKIFELEIGGDAFQFRMLLEPGAFVTSRASVFEGSQYWLEVPITAAFTLSLFGGMRIKYALGPYVALGTIGTFSKDESGVTYSQSRLDIGQWHTLGFEQNNFKNWWLDVTFSGGLMNTVSYKQNGKKEDFESTTPWGLKFAFGYNF